MGRKSRTGQEFSRHWCFTLNNYKPGDCTWDAYTMSYLVAGKEICPKTKTPHLQGYVVFNVRKRLTTVKKVLPRAHWEVKTHTPLQASNYCKKDGDFVEFGELPRSAAKVMKQKWADAYDSAKKGELDNIPKVMLIRYYHAFKRIRQDNPEVFADSPKLDNYWVVAPTRYGKSRYCRERWPDYYDKGPNKWFIGYRGQKTILLDDFGPEQMHFLKWYLKRWADVYSFTAENKGGGMTICPDRVVYAGQYTMEECFGDDQNVLDAMKERFQVIPLERWQIRLMKEDPRLGDEYDYIGKFGSWTSYAVRLFNEKVAELAKLDSTTHQISALVIDPPVVTEILDNNNDFGPTIAVHSSQELLDEMEVNDFQSPQYGLLSTAVQFMVQAEDQFVEEGLNLLYADESLDEGMVIDLTSDNECTEDEYLADDSESDDIWDFVNSKNTNK